MDVVRQPVQGWIEVIVGSMFSGKSEELIRRLRRARIARQKVQVFKPRIDTRYSTDHIVSHGEMRMESCVVDNARQLLDMVDRDWPSVGPFVAVTDPATAALPSAARFLGGAAATHVVADRPTLPDGEAIAQLLTATSDGTLVGIGSGVALDTAKLGLLALGDGVERPRFVAVQAAGCAPVVRAFQTGEDRTQAWSNPRTRAWGLRVPSPLGGFLCLQALRETHGTAVSVEEVAIERGTAELAARTGIDVCPEGGAAWAALAQLRTSGFVRRCESRWSRASWEAFKAGGLARGASPDGTRQAWGR